MNNFARQKRGISSRYLFVVIFACFLTTACQWDLKEIKSQRQADAERNILEQTKPASLLKPSAKKVVWTQGGIGAMDTLNPILIVDEGSYNISRWLYPKLFGIDPNTGEIVANEMAESWTVSDNQLTWQFTLRQNVKWTDGETVNADDFIYTYNAIRSPIVNSPRKSLTDDIVSITKLDTYTVKVEFGTVPCNIDVILSIMWIPSHLYAKDFSDIRARSNTHSRISAGPFIFDSWSPFEQIKLIRNPDYWKGPVQIDEWVFILGNGVESLRSGAVDSIELQPEEAASYQNIKDINFYSYVDDGYMFLALNQANPNNPQSGQDSQGNLIVQEPHPILSDRNVRLAIAHAIDYQRIIDDAYKGFGYRLAANVLPTVEWAHDKSLTPYAYDQELAQAILADAGWHDTGNDGLLEKDDQILKLSLLATHGIKGSEKMMEIVAENLRSVGFQIDVQLDQSATSSIYVEQLLGQTYDLLIAGWTGLRNDPNDSQIWQVRADIPESGLNYVSYHNPKIERLFEESLPKSGCRIADQAPIYKEIQSIIHEDLPYIFLTGLVNTMGYSNRFDGIDPTPLDFYHNIEEWSPKQ